MRSQTFDNIRFVESAAPLIAINADKKHEQFAYELFRRFIDVIGAICGITILSPFGLLIAIAVKLTSSGSVFFRQTRIGYKGELFTFYKFRTMKKDCDDLMHRKYINKLIKGEIGDVDEKRNGRPLYKINCDNRVTKIGGLLRAWSIDELPQLFNVLKGEMSLVGPRPAIPYEVESYGAWHLQRLEVPPGITGLWQVKGRSRTTFDGMVRLDIQYIRNRSLLLDFKILFQTIKVVLKRDGAL